MDSPTMIDEATFEDIVHRTVGSVIESYGYQPMNSDGFRARFEKSASYVQVSYDAARSHEVSIWLGAVPTDDEPPLELADVLRAVDCGAEDVKFAELIQTSDADALGRLLDRAAQLLRECAGRLLTDGREAFDAARALRAERAAAYTGGLRNRQVLEAADRAWESKDYDRVHDLLNPIRDGVGESYRRRLDFAEKKLK